MSGKYLLDTNIVIALFANDPDTNIQLDIADEIFVPSTVIGELYYGAYKSIRSRENIHRITEFTEANSILDCDASTAKVYGEIKNKLKAKGKPIPENDIWIAAIAMQYNLTLATRDHHFNNVDGLSIDV